MTENILLCDMGGTHARFAKFVAQGTYSDFKKYRLHDFKSFPDIIDTYLKDSGLSFEKARFAVARTPINGVISYKRSAGDPDYDINFIDIEKQFGWSNVLYLNDLEAGAYGAIQIQPHQLKTIIPAKGDLWNTHKVLISVGTGVGHAGIMGGKILRTAGGHWLPITVTDEQRNLEKFLTDNKDRVESTIMEDFISGRGLRTITHYVSGKPNDHLSPTEFMAELTNHPDAIRLFFEMLGLYAHTLVSVMGFYGGVYLTGGVIDNLIKNNLTQWNSFHEFFIPPVVSSVDTRLNSCAISYLLHDELPLLGLTAGHDNVA